ncbi:hypothetical protein NDI37_06970 [Funiculus sociatus GB2-A5]|uniref:Uncharacterized protein n=1 Tax=Funiculus sociatus GB2-A5 TaxID=2933946 RepID=A0ABV0JLA3_9CYAN|nr:hypothetical protein [Trichocoleus sp. FACHB-6]MBD2065489.1 hypothetical protein [Trichocoleus sp. FACHB-6]
MTAHSLHYRATSGIQGEIYYYPQADETVKDTIEIFKDRNHKIEMLTTPKEGKLLIHALILEILNHQILINKKSDQLYKYSETAIFHCFNVIKFISKAYSATINKPSNIEYNGKIQTIVEFACGLSFECNIVPSISSSTCKSLNYPVDNNLNEYIKRYMLIAQFSDMPLQLGSLYGLVEFMAYREGLKTKDFLEKMMVEFVDKTRKDLKEPIKTQRIQQQYAQIRCVRNLVSHGVCNKGDTVTTLNEVLGTKKTSHEFDRNNKEQMELVTKCSNELLGILKNYIDSQIYKNV